MFRKIFGHISTGLLLTFVLVNTSFSQEYPNKPVKIIVTFTAGGGADYMGRAIAQKLSTILKQPFVVENKTGASGSIGTMSVVQSKADGYTLLLGTTGTHSTNFATISGLPYNPLRDMTTVSIFSEAPYLLCLNPKLPIKNIKELVSYAKQNPGKLTYGSSGVGSSPHMGMEALKSALDIDMTHIPYKGLPSAMIDVMGGQISMSYDGVASAKPHIEAGNENCIANGSSVRSAILPNIPTFIESGVTNFTMGSWYGLFAPKNLPKPILNTLSKAVLEVLNDPEFKNNLANSGATGLPLNAEESLDYLQKDVARWVKIANDLNIKTTY